MKVSLQGLATGVAPGVSCQFVSIGDVTLKDSNAASNVYRIAQEALNNALRHGHATVVKISLAEEDGQLVLQVADNGTGFDPATVAHGMGLQTMDYRANMIGGWLKIDSSRDGGTTIRCIFPRHSGELPEADGLKGFDPNRTP